MDKTGKVVSYIKENYKTIRKPESPDFLHLDLLRFIAAMGVVFFHFRDGIDVGSHLSLRYMLNKIDGMRALVDMFFVISGFVICAVYSGRLDNLQLYGLFLKKRIARLVPLHWATFIFFLINWAIIYCFHIKVHHTELYDPGCIVPNIFLVQSFGFCDNFTFNGVSWSISAEMGMYLLAPVLIYLAMTYPYIMLAIVFAILAIFTAISSGWVDWAYDFGVVRAIPSFIFGAILFRLKNKLGWVPTPTILSGATLLAFFVLQPIAPRLFLVFLAYVIVIIVVAADASGKIPWFVRSSAWLGRLTYSIYMLHIIVYNMLGLGIGVKLLHLSGVWLNLWFLVCAFIDVLAGILSLVAFEMPLRSWISSLGIQRKYGRVNA